MQVGVGIIIQLVGLQMSTNEIVWRDIVALSRVVAVLQVLLFKLVGLMVEEIDIVLNDILGVRKLLVDGVRTDVVLVLVVLAVTNKIDLIFCVCSPAPCT